MTRNIDIRNFPVTRFKGSKRKVVPWLHEQLKFLTYDTVLDGFGGTSSVSYLFKKIGKSVTYNDLFRFNYLIGRCLIQNELYTVSSQEFLDFVSTVENAPGDGFISEKFSGLYFTDSENHFIEKVMMCLPKLFDGPGVTFKRNIIFYSLIQSCLIKRPFNLFHRTNLNIRTRDVQRTFGNKRTWERPFLTLMKQFTEEANSLVFSSGTKCIAMNQNIFDIEKKYDLVYLDPPYIKSKFSESSDYLKGYHFLEGLAKYNQWKTMIDPHSKLGMISRKYYDDGIRTKDMKVYITELIEKFKESIIVISYRNGGHPKISDIKEVMGSYKSNVKVVSKQYGYALSRSNNDASRNREFLIIGY